MTKTLYLSLFLAFFVTGNTASQDFNELLEHVVSNNASLKSSAAAAEGELLSLKSENNLPDPEVEFEYQWGQHDVGHKLDVSVTQSFDWPGVYASRNKAIEYSSKAMEWLNRSNYLDKKLEVKLLFIDIINVRKNLALIENRDKVMDDIIDQYEKGVANGEISILDLNKLKIEKIRFRNLETSLANQYAVLKSSLETLNGGRDCSDILEQLNDYPDDMVLPLEEYERILNENDPLTNYNKLKFDSQMQSVKAEKRSRFPGFSVGYHHNYEAGEIFNGVIVGMSIPLFSTRHKVSAAKAIGRSLQYDEEMRVIERMASMEATRDKALRLYSDYNALKSVMGNDDYMSLLKKSLDNGAISIIDYLNEMSFFLEASQDMLDALYNYHVEVATLNKYKLLN